MLNNQKLQSFLAIAPLVSFLLIFVAYFFFFISMFTHLEPNEINNPNQSPLSFIGGMFAFVILFFCTIILFLFSLIYFILHASKNPNLEGEGNMRLVWILIIVLVNGIGSFIYWLIEIRNKNPKPVIPN